MFRYVVTFSEVLTISNGDEEEGGESGEWCEIFIYISNRSESRDDVGLVFRCLMMMVNNVS